MGRRNRSREEAYVDNKLGSVYDIFRRNGVHLDDEDQDEIRRSFAGAVMDVEEDNAVEVTDDELVKAFIDGDLDLQEMTDEEFTELLSMVPVEELDDFLDNNDEDLDEEFVEDLVATVAEAITEDDEDEDEESDEDGDEDGDEDEDTDAEYDGDEDEDDDDSDEEDDEDEEDPRSFAGYQHQQRGLTQRDLDAAYRQGQRDARSIAREIAEEVVEERELNTTRAFALDQQLNDSEEIVDALVANGQLEPRQRNDALAFLISAASVTGPTRSFAAADMGDYGEDSMFDIAVGFLSKLPKNAGFGGGRRKLAPVTPSDIRSFSGDEISVVGTNKDMSYALDKTVRALMAEQAENGVKVTYREALEAVQKHARDN